MYIDEQNYVDKAEAVIKKLSSKVTKRRDGKEIPVPMVTTSKIRNLLAMSADIYNEIQGLQEEELNDEICGRIEYLRVRFIYESGREPKVKELVEESKLLDVLCSVGRSKKNYILFSRYMEALVAFRKFYGKDKDE